LVTFGNCLFVVSFPSADRVYWPHCNVKRFTHINIIGHIWLLKSSQPSLRTGFMYSHLSIQLFSSHSPKWFGDVLCIKWRLLGSLMSLNARPSTMAGIQIIIELLQAMTTILCLCMPAQSNTLWCRIAWHCQSVLASLV
jgi:hypothetical protein